jgi:hypothetical protein
LFARAECRHRLSQRWSCSECRASAPTLPCTTGCPRRSTSRRRRMPTNFNG